jgi:protein SCO1
MKSSSQRFHVNSLFGYALILLVAFSVSWAAASQSVADPSYPSPGTYKLDRIQRASSGLVLEDNNWRPHLLSSYFSGQITLFSFFYAMCRDPLGCPAAWSAFEEVKSRIEKDPLLHGKVRLVFLSLDPRTDSPEQLSFFRGKSTQDVPWNFLTTWSPYFLKSILENMGVMIAPDRDENGRKTGQINHMLKVFLIDKDGWVREIYTTSFLNPDVIMNDIRTLDMESH